MNLRFIVQHRDIDSIDWLDAFLACLTSAQGAVAIALVHALLTTAFGTVSG